MVSLKVEVAEAEVGEAAFTMAVPQTTLKFTSGNKDEEILEVRVNIIVAETDIITRTVKDTMRIATMDRRERQVIMQKAILTSLTEPSSQTEVTKDPYR